MTNAVSPKTLAVKYIGEKPEKEDNVSTTGLKWTPNQIHIVPAAAAQRLAEHTDVWQIVDLAEVDANPEKLGQVLENLPEPKTDPELLQFEKEQALNSVLPDLQNMSKSELVDFAESRFGQKLDSKNSKQNIVQQIVSLTNSGAV